MGIPMKLSPTECGILNAGAGSWAFEPLAKQLSAALGVEILNQPRRFNYVLHVDDPSSLAGINSFIPLKSLQLAADKRLLARVFNEQHVPAPETVLLNTFQETGQFAESNRSKKWCLKYPTSCGANGHRMLAETGTEPANWPKPFVVQEFIELTDPEVYRTYCAGGEIFGWVVRRFPSGAKPSPWIAHARGARYVILDVPPAEAIEVAERAFTATGLWSSFGCVDLLRTPNGQWIALEVGTDGLFNHVDRDLGEPDFERQLLRRVVDAF